MAAACKYCLQYHSLPQTRLQCLTARRQTGISLDILQALKTSLYAILVSDIGANVKFYAFTLVETDTLNWIFHGF